MTLALMLRRDTHVVHACDSLTPSFLDGDPDHAHVDLFGGVVNREEEVVGSCETLRGKLLE